MRIKAHTRYYAERDGRKVRVPGTTTVTGVINKPQLVSWANRMGLDGIDTDSYRDELADAGTCAHALIEAHLTGGAVDVSEFTPEQLSLAENAVVSYLEWERGKDIEPILVEEALVSQEHMFGGTIDLYAKVDGVPMLIDLKTSKAIYKEHRIQVAGGYSLLLEENGHEVAQVRILRIGREESEGFDDLLIVNVAECRRAFIAARELYEALKGV